MEKSEKLLYVVATLFMLTLPQISFSQNKYTLDYCVQLALERNNRMKIISTDSQLATVQYKTSKETFIPSLNFSNQHNISLGRVLDPTTYDFVENRSVYDMNATLIGSVTLFSGLSRYYNIEQARLNAISSQLSVEETKLELEIDVISRFFQILFDKETISIYQSKISLLNRQEEQIIKRIEYKAAVPADLLNIQADITNAKVELIEATGNLQSDIISLCEIIGIDDWLSFDVSITDIDITKELILDNVLFEGLDDIVSNLPSVRLTQVKSDIARFDAKIASASYWPTLKMDVGFVTTLSNARSKIGNEDYPLREQFNDNMSSYLSMTISLPLLSAVNISQKVKEKKLVYTRTRYEHEVNKTSCEKEITLAAVLTKTAYSKYKLLSDDVSKCEEALCVIDEKYALGVATYYDYQTAVNSLYQAKAKESQAIFEYLLRKNIVRLYINQF